MIFAHILSHHKSQDSCGQLDVLRGPLPSSQHVRTLPVTLSGWTWHCGCALISSSLITSTHIQPLLLNFLCSLLHLLLITPPACLRIEPKCPNCFSQASFKRPGVDFLLSIHPTAPFFSVVSEDINCEKILSQQPDYAKNESKIKNSCSLAWMVNNHHTRKMKRRHLGYYK